MYTIRVCEGPSCTKNGGGALLSACAALAGEEVEVMKMPCTSKCQKGVNIIVDDEPFARLVQAESDEQALETAKDAVSEAGGDVSELIGLAWLIKMEADAALRLDNPKAAVKMFTEALDLIPEELLTTPTQRPPDGEPTDGRGEPAPIHVQWVHEALIGRCLARMQLNKPKGARKDARAATKLCCNEAIGWEALAEAEEACGNEEGAESAREVLASL